MGRRFFWLVLLLVATCTVARSEEPNELLTDSKPEAPPKFTNRLAKEKSPYLLQHAHNPVDWYPWGEEAFAKAKKENKPIFLSVGYSTCHWCHVMEREAFSDESVAKLINDNFVPIKVDREERPDVDRVYMTYVTASTGSGGWPMTVVLTPDRKPIFGGTYFPVEEKFGRPGLKQILTKITDVWKTDRKSIEDVGDKVESQLKQFTTIDAGQAVAIERSLLEKGYESFVKRFDEKNGGFSTAPKFPSPVDLNFLLTYFHRSNEPKARDMVLTTLRAMAAGGIHDQLGGGFHRYSTDAKWFLPHFEKMLYDQAQLAGVYLDAYQVTHDAFFADVARDIFQYVLRDLTASQGRFYSAEDADSAFDAKKPDEKGEGAFYVWTSKEIDDALGANASKFKSHFGVKPDGNVAVDPQKEFTGKNVLFAANSDGGDFAESKSKLLAIRSKRPRPHLDDKTIVAWNALMISSLARAGVILHEPEYTAAATKAAGFIRDSLYDAKTRELKRIYRDGPSNVAGFLDDYAFYVESLIDLYESTFDVQWLKLALDLQSTQDRLFADEKAGGYFTTRDGDASLLLRMKEDGDNVEPAGASVAARNLFRLSQMTDDKAHRERAEKTIRLYTATLERVPSGMPRMLSAIDFHLDKPKQIVIAGNPASPDTSAILELIHKRFLPNRIILNADGAEGQSFIASRMPFFKDLKPLGGKATAYVCENYACQRPTSDLAVLEKQLEPAKTPTR